MSYAFGFQLCESEVADYKPKEGAAELLVIKKNDTGEVRIINTEKLSVCLCIQVYVDMYVHAYILCLSCNLYAADPLC